MGIVSLGTQEGEQSSPLEFAHQKYPDVFTVLKIAMGKVGGIGEEDTLRTGQVFVEFKNGQKESPEGRPGSIGGTPAMKGVHFRH